ncbi:alpha-ketoglutarate-dependent dioxygenase AlkB family protein [Poseidonocella sedimentorum]|uniref:Alkylated DNA repair protein (DNA oxidative demethylase) n=1 Tax=Poseidonocella sedimentorum TaxID=871652 RepID=A0A1I6D416_9RHOB|nr:alpha-ketoglutarate-dependent dioxygenase AlkB [Poseidonocella sedimentorum]SFR00234.1 alkylated DNA repair protein (DNA oxidative demethylase) [Poseidonocella sedimentorum]
MVKMRTIRGFEIHDGRLSRTEQERWISALREVISKAPLYAPVTRWGKPMSVRMTSAGAFGWYTDRRGYRYEPRHPDGQPWPPIPQVALELWEALVPGGRHPECCLINHYREGARMGLHQDRDEADFSWPVVSVSLGAPALFRIGNVERGGPTESVWLNSGDVVVMGGEARLRHHGIDRIKPDASDLLPEGGRFNVTMRVVT